MENFLYEKKGKIFLSILGKSFISILILLFFHEISKLGSSSRPLLNSTGTIILFFCIVYGFVSWIYVAAMFFHNWFLGIIGGFLAFAGFMFIAEWASKQGVVVETIIAIIGLLLTIGAFFLDVIRLLISFGKIRRLNKRNSFQADDLFSGAVTNNTTNNMNLHLTGDIKTDTDFLLQLKNSGMISEEQFQQELRNLTSK